MATENNFSVLPWYKTRQQQNARKWWTYGRVYPLYTPAGYIPPFQIIRSHVSPTIITSFRLYTSDGRLVGDYTTELNNSGFSIVQFEDLGYDVMVYTGAARLVPQMDNGQYYGVITDGYNVYYSEIFTVVNDIAPYLKIEWYDDENFVMDNGMIVYKNPSFKNVMYLPSDIAKPEYDFTDEVIERDGYQFPIKQISKKRYHFSFWAAEYILDVARFIRMADHIKIMKDAIVYDVNKFLITPSWEDNGDVASVDAEFETDTVAKKLPYIGAYIPPVPPTPPQPTDLQVSPTNITFAQAGGATTITITTNVAWSLNLPAWITANVSSGRGNAVVTLTAQNNTGAQRTENVVVSTNEESINVQCNQLGTAVVQSIEFDGSILAIDADTTTTTIRVKSTDAWSIVSKPDWVTGAVPNNGTGGETWQNITLAIAKNTATTQRTGTIRAELIGDATKHTEMDITQWGAEVRHYLSAVTRNTYEDNVICTQAGSADAIQIYASGPWTARADSDWIKTTGSQPGVWSGNGDTILWYRYDTNEGVERNGRIIVSLTDTDLTAIFYINQIGIIAVYPKYIFLSANGGTGTITVHGHTPWLLLGQGQANYDPNYGGKQAAPYNVRYDYPANTEFRTQYYDLFIQNQLDETQRVEFTVIQAPVIAEDMLRVVRDNINVGRNDTRADIFLLSTQNWKASYIDSRIKMEPEAGRDSGSDKYQHIVVKFPQNTTGRLLSMVVRFQFENDDTKNITVFVNQSAE